MATPRLPFLWPMLFRATEMSAGRSRPVVQRRALQSTTRRCQDTAHQRYGTANQPIPSLGSESQLLPATVTDEPGLKSKIGERFQTDREKKADASRDTSSPNQDAKREPTTTDLPDERLSGDPVQDSKEASPKREPPPPLKTPAEKPLESLLDSVPDPTSNSQAAKDGGKKSVEEDNPSITYDEHQPPVHAPHIEAPRFVHHFDTFGLVRHLEEGGWKDEQAITVMKSMRLMLADNMELAREALVSKSQVENETYLFKAACSELKTEVTTRRKGEQEKMRTQRTQLQHEVDILNQRLSQDDAALKDELKGMFDDRKMAVRNEQRDMERKIQELNYKITVSLQADSKSDVESLRWVLTRRVIMTLGIVVIMVLSSLKLYSNEVHEKEQEAKRRAKMKHAGTQMESSGVGTDNDATHQSSGGGQMLVQEGDNPAFVSLG